MLDAGPDPATGTRRQRWKGGDKTRKAAEAALRELAAEVGAGTYIARSALTVGDYLADWLETIRPRSRATSWNSYREPLPGAVRSGAPPPSSGDRGGPRHPRTGVHVETPDRVEIDVPGADVHRAHDSPTLRA
jgi:hypothetical protein